MIESMLSTIDNPYNPFDDWDGWYSFDTRQGYYTSTYLGRVVRQTEDLGQSVLTSDIDRAIDEIIEDNVLGLYIKVSREVPDEPEDLPNPGEVQ